MMKVKVRKGEERTLISGSNVRMTLSERNHLWLEEREREGKGEQTLDSIKFQVEALSSIFLTLSLCFFLLHQKYLFLQG